MSLTIIDVMRPEVEDYLDHLRTGKNISDSTAVSYRRILGAFYDYALGPEGPGSLEDVVPETLQAYENRLRLSQYALRLPALAVRRGPDHGRSGRCLSKAQGQPCPGQGADAGGTVQAFRGAGPP